jgi:HSP20 family molecular chaperone IbpA
LLLDRLPIAWTCPSGEKKAEAKRDEKGWQVEELSYGSFYRSMSLPFSPDDGAVEAHLDKGAENGLDVTAKPCSTRSSRKNSF